MAEWANAVIVVGAGLSGATAALTAIEKGAKVILVEKEKKPGGNSVRASSGINAAGTIHQKQQGVKDSVELFSHDTAFSCVKDINAKPTDMIMTLCENSAEAVHWLDKQNIQLPVLSQCGGHSAPRTHRPTTGAAGGYMTLGLIQKIKLAQDAGHVKMIKEAKMTKLLKNNAGKINGIEYESTKDKTKHTLRGASVIIATGGFCFNENLIKQYGPHLIDLPTTNGPWARGEGMLVASEVGAQLVDMELIQVHPTGFIKPDHPNEKEKILAAECLRAAGALLINKDGHRFVNELGHRDDVTAAIRGQSGPIRILLNPAAVKEVAPHVKMYRDFFKVLWAYPNGKALADDMKIPVENLQDTFQTYNSAAKKGWCPSSKDRFPAVPFDINQELTVGFVTPVLHYVMGGIKINTKAQALGPNDSPIEGLFACGETTGGVHGRNRLAGNSLVDCVVYGRIAGKSASTYVKSSKL